MSIKKTCMVCGQSFSPDNRHPYQKVCFNKKCRISQRTLLLKRWRIRNPDYFKNRQDNLDEIKIWRKEHPDYYKQYRRNNPRIRERTRMYVSAYRKRTVSKNKKLIDISLKS